MKEYNKILWYETPLGSLIGIEIKYGLEERLLLLNGKYINSTGVYFNTHNLSKGLYFLVKKRYLKIKNYKKSLFNFNNVLSDYIKYCELEDIDATYYGVEYVRKGNNIECCSCNTYIEEANILIGTTHIAMGGFKECTKLRLVNLPASLREIKRRAFYRCSKLYSVFIPKSVTLIDTEAFRSSALKEVDFGGKLKTLKDLAFAQTDVQMVELSVESHLGIGVFMGCSSLSCLILKGVLDEVPTRLCQGCSSLKYLTLPDEDVRVGYLAFQGCTSLKNYKLLK